MTPADPFGFLFMAVIASPFAWIWFKGWNQKTGRFPRFVNWELKHGRLLAHDAAYKVRSKQKTADEARKEVKEHLGSCQTLGLAEHIDIITEYECNY